MGGFSLGYVARPLRRPLSRPVHEVMLLSSADGVITTAKGANRIEIRIAAPAHLAGTYPVDITALAGGPLCLVPPLLRDADGSGAELIADGGLWACDADLGEATIAGQWLADNLPIGGETGPSLTPGAEQIGKQVGYAETARQAGQETIAKSAVVAVPGLRAPTVLVEPSLTRTEVTLPDTVHFDPGSYDGDPAPRISVEFDLDGLPASLTDNSYHADTDKTATWKVTAENGVGEPVMRILTMTAHYPEIALSGGALVVQNGALILEPPSVEAGWPVPEITLTALERDGLDVREEIVDSRIANAAEGSYQATWTAGNGKVQNATQTATAAIGPVGQQQPLAARAYLKNIGIVHFDPVAETGYPASAVSGLSAARIDAGRVAIDTDSLELGQHELIVTCGDEDRALPISIGDLVLTYGGDTVSLDYPADTPSDTAITFVPGAGDYAGETVAFTPGDLANGPYCAIPPQAPQFTTDTGTAGSLDSGDVLTRGRPGLWLYTAAIAPVVTASLRDQSGVLVADFEADDYTGTGSEATSVFVRETAGSVSVSSATVPVVASAGGSGVGTGGGISDGFNVANSTVLENYVGASGETWTRIGTSTSMEVWDNAITYGSEISPYYRGVADRGASYAVEGDIRKGSRGDRRGVNLAVRVIDSGNYIALRTPLSTETTFKVRQKVGGTYTTLFAFDVPAGWVNAGDTFRAKLKVSGGTVTAYVNGVQVGTGTTTITSGGGGGLAVDFPTTQISGSAVDNFTVYEEA